MLSIFRDKKKHDKTRSFNVYNRFKIATLHEVFIANDDDGSFNQVAGPYEYQATLDAYNALLEHPEFVGKKLFIVSVERVPILGNFNPDSIVPITRNN